MARLTTGYHQATRSFKIKKNYTEIHQAARMKVRTPMIETPALIGTQRQQVRFSVFLLLQTQRQQQHSLRLSSFSSKSQDLQDPPDPAKGLYFLGSRAAAAAAAVAAALLSFGSSLSFLSFFFFLSFLGFSLVPSSTGLSSLASASG